MKKTIVRWLNINIMIIIIQQVCKLVSMILFRLDVLTITSLHSFNMTILPFIVYIIVVRAFMQPQIIFQDCSRAINEKAVKDTGDEYQKYHKSALKKQESEQYLGKLKDLIEHNKIYRDNSITLDNLSAELQISRNKLSQIINEEYGLNFNTFMNKYRIEEVQKYLTGHIQADCNLIEIVYKCGFTSRSSFFRNFKQFTGLTPQAYQKKHRNKCA